MKVLALAAVILAISTSYPPLASALVVIWFVGYVFNYIGITKGE